MKLAIQVLGVVALASEQHDSCGDVDHTALLQEKRFRSAGIDHVMLQASAVKKSAPAKSLERKDYVNKMFNTAEDMVKEKSSVTPTVVRFVADVLQNIDETVLPAIEDEHTQDQEMLTLLWAPVDAAVALAARHEQTIAGLQQEYNTAGAQHTTCRGVETENCARVVNCQMREDAAKAILDTKEETVAEIQESISGHWCGASVVKSELTFRDAARPRLQRYLDAEVEADAAREAHAVIVEECIAENAAQQAQRATCNEKQQILETASCTYSSTVDSARIEVEDAYRLAVAAYDIAVQNVQIEEADRKLEFGTLQQTRCLLDRIHDAPDEPCDDTAAAPTGEVDAQIQSCHSLVVDTTHLDVTYNTAGPEPVMPEVPVFPCSQEYVALEYSTLTPVNTCAGPATCVACAGLEPALGGPLIVPLPQPGPITGGPLIVPLPQPIEAPPATGYTRHDGMYLPGHAAGDGTIRNLVDSRTRCDELWNGGDTSCAGVTCGNGGDTSCTVRGSGGSDLRVSPSGEVSYARDVVPEFTTMPVPAETVCVETGFKWAPIDMPGQSRSVAADSNACKLRCAGVSGCAHFSFWPDGGCHIQNAAATRTVQSNAVSGNPHCWSMTRQDGMYLPGHAGGDGTIRNLVDARTRCDELAALCAGVTCGNGGDTSCTVRGSGGSDLRVSPSGEVSYERDA